MSDTSNTKKGVNRETVLLIALAAVGLVGLLVLQFARKSPARNAADKTLVQNQGQEAQADAQATQSIQKIEGELWRTTDEYVEAGKPFKFKLKKFSPGAVYELELSNGLRRPFVDGSLSYTFNKGQEVTVALYAQYEGRTIKLDSMRVLVAAHKPQKEVIMKAVDL